MSIVMGVTYPELFAGIGVSAGIEYQAALNVFNAYSVMASKGPSPLNKGELLISKWENGQSHCRSLYFMVTLILR